MEQTLITFSAEQFWAFSSLDSLPSFMPFAKLPKQAAKGIRPQGATSTDKKNNKKKYKAFAGPFHLQRGITTKRPTLIAAIKFTKNLTTEKNPSTCHQSSLLAQSLLSGISKFLVFWIKNSVFWIGEFEIRR